jgi:hypothetical protein
MLNFINNYSFLPVSGCVGMDTSALLCPVAYNASKTALLKIPSNMCIQHKTGESSSRTSNLSRFLSLYVLRHCTIILFIYTINHRHLFLLMGRLTIHAWCNIKAFVTWIVDLSRNKCLWLYIYSDKYNTRGSVGWACVAHLSFCFVES